jgi:hypothetical protein
VVTLAPDPDGRLVTSQRAVVEAVDSSQQTLTLITDHGQHVRLGQDEAGSDRLGYGYAITVHSAQGGNIHRAHLFADGGGRELAYVAMSRARQSTQVWTVADDLPQAVEDLRRDRSTRRTPTWAIDVALPDPATFNRDRFQALPPDQQTRLAAVVRAEQAIGAAAIAGIGLPDRAATLGQAKEALETARQARARAARERAEQTAQHADRWRDRHCARKQNGQWTQQQAHALQRWATYVAPQVTRLDQEIARLQTTLEQAAARLDHHEATIKKVVEHGLDQQCLACHIGDQLKECRDNIDGVPTTADIRRAATLAQQRQTITTVPDAEPPAVCHVAPEL